MKTSKKSARNQVLDRDIERLLAFDLEPILLPADIHERMRTKLMARVEQQSHSLREFITVRNYEGE